MAFIMKSLPLLVASLDFMPLSLLNRLMELGRLSLNNDTFLMNHGVYDFTPGNGKETHQGLVWLTGL